MIRKVLVIGFLCLGMYVYATDKGHKIPDTLRYKTYDYLFDRIEDPHNSEAEQLIYLCSFLNKARLERNWEEIVNGYKNYLHHSPEPLKLIYADSMVYTAKRSKDTALIGAAYLSKGIVYYGKKEHNKALDNYLIANGYISKTDDEYQKNKVNYNIAHIKYYLGFYNEAVALFKECLEYFKEESDRAYLNTIHSLALCYNKIGDYGKAMEMNNMGLTEGERLKNHSMDTYFNHMEGVNHYFKDNYATAINKISGSLPDIRKNKDFANESVGYFYIGKSHWALKRREKAVKYFRKVDRIFKDKGYIRPDLRENYELMIDYYKSKNDLVTRLHYICKLLQVDSILNNKYKYLSGKIHKEYDTKNLLIEKEAVQNLLDKREERDKLLLLVIVFLLGLSLFLTYRYVTNKKRYRKRFEELMKKNGVTTQKRTLSKKELSINPDAVAEVLEQLEKFEGDKKFLDKNWTLVKLSAAFNSNTNYLSKIIFHYRNKKFVEYLNDLRVDYIIKRLKEDKVVRNYTNKALAEEAGFSTTQRFTNAFKSRTGISPTYFIEELAKE